MQIKKAIIPVAGWGTRRLPITKALEKAMLPIGNRPLVDYVVEDCAKAGITEIYFVIDDKPHSQIKSYYSPNLELAAFLRAHGKADRLASAERPWPKLNFHFYQQQAISERYGSAEPVAQIVEAFGLDEPVAVLMGDDFVFNADGSSELARLVDAVAGADSDTSAMLAATVPKDVINKYGVLELSSDRLTGIYEKPTPDAAPSNLINISKYIFSPSLLRRIVSYCRDNHFAPNEQEYLITDPILAHVRAGGLIHVLPIKGQYLDGGSLEGWLHANRVVCET